MPSFLETEAASPVFCDRHDAASLRQKGVVGIFRSDPLGYTPVEEIGPLVEGKVCSGIFFSPNLDFILFQTRGRDSLILFPVGFHTVGAQLLPADLYSPSDDLMTVLNPPQYVDSPTGRGLRTMVDDGLVLGPLSHGQFQDGSLSEDMLALRVQPSYCLDFDTGNWSFSSDELARQVFVSWRGTPPGPASK